MARKYPYDTSRQALYQPAAGATFFEAWDPGTDTSNHDLLCAEMSRLAYAGREQVASSLESIGFMLRLWFGGEAREERLRTKGTDGFVATSAADGLTVLAVRGTEANKPEDLLADLLARSEAWDQGGLVHQGFARTYATVREAIREELTQHAGRLLITGHSLGAALATLAAADHAARRPTLITFGSPRVGDAAFARLLAGLPIRRFVGCCDVVTRVPPEQFEQPHIHQLLTDLIPERLVSAPFVKGLVSIVAFGLSGALRAVGIQPQYVHVGEAEYKDRAGKPLASATTIAIAEDQRAARAAYPGSPLRALTELMQQIQTAVTTAGDGKRVRDAVRTFGTALFSGDPVPLRDLADHAPINYVSIFSGRVQ
jgi:triacylglycerol lipase